MSASSTRVTTGGTARSIKRRTPSTQWSDDLPNDLLGTVYSNLASPLDRVRFAAVSKPWRVAAITMRRTAPLTILPWLIFFDDHGNKQMKHMYCPGSGEVFRFPLPSRVVGKKLVGSHDGGWVAAAGRHQTLAIVNLFSGAEVALSMEQKRVFYQRDLCVFPKTRVGKIVFSESPTSSSCILAAITNSHEVAFCRVGSPVDGWTPTEFGGEPIVDIIFCNEELYGLTATEDLIYFEIGTSKDRSQVFAATAHKLHIERFDHPSAHMTCIVELHGKLALVVRAMWLDHYKPFVKVFELANVAGTPNIYRWVEVTSLGDYALFIGKTLSKAVYVPAGRCGGVQRNCIYDDNVVYLRSLDNHDGYNYLTQNESVGDGIKSAGSSIACGPRADMWILPPEF